MSPQWFLIKINNQINSTEKTRKNKHSKTWNDTDHVLYMKIWAEDREESLSPSSLSCEPIEGQPGLGRPHWTPTCTRRVHCQWLHSSRVPAPVPLLGIWGGCPQTSNRVGSIVFLLPSCPVTNPVMHAATEVLAPESCQTCLGQWTWCGFWSQSNAGQSSGWKQN